MSLVVSYFCLREHQEVCQKIAYLAKVPWVDLGGQEGQEGRCQYRRSEVFFVQAQDQDALTKEVADTRDAIDQAVVVQAAEVAGVAVGGRTAHQANLLLPWVAHLA